MENTEFDDAYFLKIQESMNPKTESDDDYSRDQESWANDAKDDRGSKQSKHEGDDHVIRVRGLPWSTKEKDVRDFFSVCDNIVSVHFTYSREGRPTGEAYIELGSEEDAEKALTKNRELLGQRYIEVFLSKKDEMEFVLKRNGRHSGLMGSGHGSGSELGDSATPDPETVVRLRGLPYGCTKEDIVTFFDGLEIATDGIVFSAQQSSFGPQSGKKSKPGEAYVRFVNKETTERALDRHMNRIGHRYIEVFRSTVEEMERMGNQGGKVTGGYGRSGTRPGPYSLTGSGPIPLCAIPFPDFGDFPMDRHWDDGPRSHSGRSGRRSGRSGGGQDMYGGYYSSNGNQPPGFFGGGMDDGGRYMAGRATGHVVHMRGLPFKATANDIMEFFQPLKLVNVQVLYDNRTGRPSGEAEVELCSHEDALEAMKKDRHDMGGRYIELFMNSRPVPLGSNARGGYGMRGSPSPNGSMGMSGMSGMMSGGNADFIPSLVQYPGFGAYSYGRPDVASAPLPAQPPPPPPSDSGNSGSGYF